MSDSDSSECTSSEDDANKDPSFKYRAANQSRRSGRAQVDHDIFEGLPVRNWRRQTLTVGAAPKVETTNNRNLPSELPMPKDSHLLCPMSRALLQAARAGRVNKPPQLAESEIKDGPEDEDPGKEEAERIFSLRRWQVVPRHLEPPEPEYLAKRRKGLKGPSINGVLGPSAGGGVVKRTTVRKIDIDGNSMVQEVLVPEGQKVEGEIISEVTMTDASAPGTVLEGVGVVNADGVVVSTDIAHPTPSRRRPPPPRRKPKGFKRGRRKQVQFNEGAAAATAAPSQNSETASGQTNGEGVQQAINNQSTDTNVGDVEMGEDSNLQDGEQDGEDSGDEGDEGEEGDEGDEDDREDGELSPSREATESKSPSKAHTLEPPRSVPELPPNGAISSLPPKPHVTVPPAEIPSERPEDTMTSTLEVAATSVPEDPEGSEMLMADPILHEIITEPATSEVPQALPEEVPSIISSTLDDQPRRTIEEPTSLVPEYTTSEEYIEPDPPKEHLPTLEELPQDEPSIIEEIPETRSEKLMSKPSSPVEAEVDLFGSLERHLDGQQTTVNAPSTTPTNEDEPVVPQKESSPRDDQPAQPEVTTSEN
ncbi:MAG: hypothetical protein M4579_004892 [Chaenotheca gracillima]|nr:MAG: hypothetical protein M4579_004892 [Chaenotheca gracillima]